jgi:hypothetical protein
MGESEGMNIRAAALFAAVIAVYALSPAAAEGVVSPISSVQVYGAQSGAASEMPQLDEEITAATSRALASLYFLPDETGPVLEVHPGIGTYTHEFNESSQRYEVSASVELDLIIEGDLQSHAIELLASDSRLDSARQKAVDQYERQIGYLFAQLIDEDVYYQIDSLYNGIISGKIPESSSVRPGDVMAIMQDGKTLLSELIVSHTYPYNQDGTLHAAEYQVSYTRVPLRAGMVLMPRGRDGFDIRMNARQSLSSTDLEVTAFRDIPGTRLGWSFGFAGGYSWGAFPRLPVFIDGSESGWAGVTAGLAMQLYPGTRYREHTIQLFSARFHAQAELGIGFDQRWFVGTASQVELSYRLSSSLEAGAVIGFQIRRTLDVPGTLLRASGYVGPSVTFTL